ncbi:MAG: rod-binding protein [Candidatus Devosia phytovorans]|uniref:Rod-binding protein n=1 Tax=Candidatus Devosia phytovorans TaxID=3121372 RepID=A0AAJ5VY04_9HYPH|nr:rod-binding protein [Devosia sp.]WEK05537.1 MAG: rod-binding protein [Devosia sp.]
MDIQTPMRKPGSTLTTAQYEKVRSQAEELEGVFLNTLTKELFSSIKTDESVMGGGFGEETWRSMQSEQIAANMAQNGGLGIAEQLLPDLLAMQEAANNQNKMPGAFK